MRPLLAFTGLYVLVTPEIRQIRLPAALQGRATVSRAGGGWRGHRHPPVELAIMPFSVMLGRRVGLLWLMSIGAAFGVAANIYFATIGSAVGMFAGQILMGGLWGIFASLGIIAAQRLLPTAVTTASAIFMSSTPERLKIDDGTG